MQNLTSMESPEEKSYLTVLRSLIAHEEFISETKGRMLECLNKFKGSEQADKDIL